MSGPATAWAFAGSAIANTLNQIPLPKGVSEAKVGHWRLRINNSKEPLDGLDPYCIEAQSDEYLAFAILAPGGGAIGGYTEDQFIEDMTPALPVGDPLLLEVNEQVAETCALCGGVRPAGSEMGSLWTCGRCNGLNGGEGRYVA